MSALKDLKKILKPEDLTFIDLTSFDDFSGIEEFRNLIEVKLRKCRSSCFPFPVQELKKLERLDMSQNNLQEISNLPRSVQFCDFSFNQLSTLVFSRLKRLQELNISNNRVSSLDPLVNLTGLLYLYAKDNLISGLHSLTSLNIIELDISNNLIQTYTALSPVLSSIQVLKITSNPCTKSSSSHYFTDFNSHPEHLYSRKSLNVPHSKLLKNIVCTKSIQLSKSTIIQKLSSELLHLKGRNKSLVKKVEKIEKEKEVKVDSDVFRESLQMGYEDWLSSLHRYQFLKKLYSSSGLVKMKTSGKRLVAKQERLMQSFNRLLSDF